MILISPRNLDDFFFMDFPNFWLGCLQKVAKKKKQDNSKSKELNASFFTGI